ncbi:MAG TPA: hypothetical protein VMG58_10110, partial [Candidatus Sulfotelmatobacter sp.]|nr:hypothetical protein [Candidatus Sulfotelmatobacter sp.]
MRRLIDAPPDGEPRFLEGTAHELEELFGGRLPELPGRERPRDIGLVVDLAPALRKDLRDLLGAIIRSLDNRPGGADGPPAGSGHVYARFEETLEELLITVLQRERRLGLLNLFWLAHSKDAAGLIQEVFSQPGIAPLKYRMHPLLRGAYRNAQGRAGARVRALPGQLIDRNLGREFNSSLIDAILDDQLPLTEP